MRKSSSSTSRKRARSSAAAAASSSSSSRISQARRTSKHRRVIRKVEKKLTSECIYVVFLIDVGTAIADKSEGSVREEGLPYEALNLLIQRLLRAIDIIGRSSPNQKRLMWGYRCFDARSAVGCTPKELDKSIWKRPNGQTIPFRPLDAKSVEAMQRDVAKIVSKGDAMRKSTSSIKLSQREILERSVNEVASEFWSEMSNIGIGGRTDDRHATIVLSPCPCSASNLAHFMSDTDGTVSVVGGTRSASAIAPTDMGGLAAASAASRKTLEEATLRGLIFSAKSVPSLGGADSHYRDSTGCSRCVRAPRTT